jgi:hypothetical protein
MQTRHRNPFTTIHTEGAILPSDLLQRVLENDKSLVGLSPEGYHLSGEKLTEATTHSWNRLQGSWAAFRTSRGRLGAGDAGTTLTRERWLLPLFQELGYGRLLTAKAVEIDGKSYPISHGWANVPIHLVGCGVDLDKRSAGVAGASRSSPHSLMQEVLNRSEGSLWGFVSNGLRLRVMRDNASLTRQAFLEFDLEAMFEGEVYSDFVLLWLICHQSRVEAESPAEFILEQWSKTAQEQGTRALDQLRSGVEQAIAALGSGFLRHPANKQLIADLRSGALSRQEYYRQLLRLVYRLIFLFVAEDRDLLFDPQADPAARERYSRYYSLHRLRRLAERQRGGRHADLYVGFKLVTDILGGRGPHPQPLSQGERGVDIAVAGLGLPTLGSFLFSGEAVRALEAAELENQSFLSAIRHLTFIEEGRSRRAVDYKNLGAEELGSVYEALLELHPDLNTDAGMFSLATAGGNERKTTGSYYTPSSLIQVLLDSALDPVIEAALGARRDASTQEQALLDLKVCDPACGSGHFLIAASHRIARRLAAVRSGDDEPSPTATRAALREVIAHCIYGVDANPMAVELCKVNLWLESLAPGKPLSFLDAHIQCGDSLVGVSPGLDIREIPDEAFNPAFGDDKATASALKKRNKRERGGDNPQGYGQLGFRISETQAPYGEDLAQWLVKRAAQVDAMPEDDSTQVLAKSIAFEDYHSTNEYLKNRLGLDLWTVAFFWSIPKADAESLLAPSQQEFIQLRTGGELDARLVEKVHELADRLNFFHWELAFPQVFSGENPGFDCMLGNPPWERIKLQEQEFFALRDPEIANAPNKAARQKFINDLVNSNPALAHAFEDAKHAADATSKFVRESKRFPLTAVGDVNTYALFAELFRSLLTRSGRTGIIVPTGIATDSTTKDFFGDLMQKQNLARLVGFENEAFIFPSVHHAFKFCLLTITGESIQIPKTDFIFLCRHVSDVPDKKRHFYLSSKDLALLNPNTFTCPIFRTGVDADLTKGIYERVPVFQNEVLEQNPWGVRFTAMFHMANDSGLFITQPQPDYLPLYEAKMIFHFDHRYTTYENATQANLNAGILPPLTEEQKQNPNQSIKFRYWIPKSQVDVRLVDWSHDWLLGFRDITSSVVERTAIFSVLPKFGVGHTMPLLFVAEEYVTKVSCLLANLNSLIFDYSTRQKVGGTHLTYGFLRQIPVLSPSAYTPTDIDFIALRVLELVYTAYDLRPFAEDMGYHGEPFHWDEVRRAQLRAELDAYYARLYGLTRDELRYILDPKEVYGEDFPGETFRVLKEKEIRQFGEYRTRRLVLEKWDQLESGIEGVEEIVQPLEPAIEISADKRSLPEITWIPVDLTINQIHQEHPTSIQRQTYTFAWLLVNFGTGRSIPSYDAQKYSYFLQRTGIADLEVSYKEFARGPYSPDLKYKAGTYAKNKGFWEVLGNNIARRKNIGKAVNEAEEIFTNVQQARGMVEQLEKMSKDDLGGLATVDFAARKIFEKSQAITPGNIRSYFQSDWTEKVDDSWYTDENINQALDLLTTIGLFEKMVPSKSVAPAKKEPEPVEEDPIQPMLSDFGLYKCIPCDKMVMGYEKENHEKKVHGGRSVEWRRIK